MHNNVAGLSCQKVKVNTICVVVLVLLLSFSFPTQFGTQAFAISPISTIRKSSTLLAPRASDKNNKSKQQLRTTMDPLIRIRGGGGPAAAATTATTATAPPKPPKKLRLLALDGIRFVLAMHIVLGHFLRFANPSEFWLKFFAQINVTVGAFFALSGYMAAYTSTEVGEPKPSARLTDTPSQTWWLSKCMSYYPMHWLVLLLFSPMFIYTNVQQAGGWWGALWHGLLSITLTQAWFPMHAEVWNAPTWYLSSLTFSTAVLPFSLPKIATMTKRSLRKTAGWLTLLKLLPVLGYCYDHNAFGIVEGMTLPKAHPAFAVFNTQRFHPVFNTADILLGAVACRLAMMDSSETEKTEKPTQTNWLSTAIPFGGLLAILALRAASIVPDVSDLLVRSILFTPLFLNFVMASHRNAVAKITNDVVSNILGSKLLVWLGGLSFPIYIVHGPLGQVFYKRLIAGKLWGGVLMGPKFFALYMTTVFLSAYLLQILFLNNQAVGNWSKQKVKQFASWM